MSNDNITQLTSNEKEMRYDGYIESVSASLEEVKTEEVKTTSASLEEVKTEEVKTEEVKTEPKVADCIEDDKDINDYNKHSHLMRLINQKELKTLFDIDLKLINTLKEDSEHKNRMLEDVNKKIKINTENKDLETKKLNNLNKLLANSNKYIAQINEHPVLRQNIGIDLPIDATLAELTSIITINEHLISFETSKATLERQIFESSNHLNYLNDNHDSLLVELEHANKVSIKISDGYKDKLTEKEKYELIFKTNIINQHLTKFSIEAITYIKKLLDFGYDFLHSTVNLSYFTQYETFGSYIILLDQFYTLKGNLISRVQNITRTDSEKLLLSSSEPSVDESQDSKKDNTLLIIRPGIKYGHLITVSQINVVKNIIHVKIFLGFKDNYPYFVCDGQTIKHFHIVLLIASQEKKHHQTIEMQFDEETNQNKPKPL
jgi:hypothetical protein